MSSGNGSQACLLLVQTVRAGRGKVGSAKAPTATLTRSGERELSQNTEDPQFGQKWKLSTAPLSAVRAKTRRSPSRETTWPRAKKEVEPNTAPVRRWQAMQWQEETSFGAPFRRMRSCPQEQAASCSSDIDQRPLRISPASLISEFVRTSQS